MTLLPLAAALVVLMIDSAIELAMISSMVGYLHRSGANIYPFHYQGGIASVEAKPKGLELNQGHTSNGAAGTALVAVSLGGFLVLFLQRRREKKGVRSPSRLFLAYAIFTVISALFTLCALAYVFAVRNQTKGHSIDEAVAAHTPKNAKYPLEKWSPGAWTRAILALPLTSQTDRNYLNHWLKVMNGWEWNIIPMFLIGVVVAVLAVLTCLKERNGYRRPVGVGEKEESRAST